MNAPVPLCPLTANRTQASRTSTAATPGARTSSRAAGKAGLSVAVAGTSAQSALPTSQLCSTLNQSVPGFEVSVPRTTNSARSAAGRADRDESARQETLPGEVDSVQPGRGSALLHAEAVGDADRDAGGAALRRLQAWPTRKAAA